MIAISCLAFITLGWYFVLLLTVFINTSIWTSYFILVSISSLGYFIFYLIRYNDEVVHHYSEYALKGSVEDRQTQITEYKKSVNRLFEQVNKDIALERNRIENLIENQWEKLQKQILSRRLAYSQLEIESVQNIRRGRTELFFLEYLYKIFHRDVKIDVAPVMNNAFRPDFVVVCSDLGLYVDIEIDEPYVLDSGEVIHHDRSRDSIRNKFFISHNWIVIRFSERQIVNDPCDCALFVRNVLLAIGRKESFVETTLKGEPMWTYEEAQLMKLKDERRTYLKHLRE